MAALRSRRLEALFGAPVSEVSYAQVAAIANGTVEETFDLDFKSGPYDRADKGKKALSTDVAALANTAGGLIILGLTEDKQARAIGVSHMAVSDDEINRMLMIVAAGVGPLPDLDIWLLEDPNQSGTGFILVAVPRSPAAPHAVLLQESLRYPRRNGRTTTYLSEPELAQAYRDRFAGLQSRLDAAAEHEAYLINRLKLDDKVYAVVTLVPDLDGHVDIDTRSFRQFQTSMVGKDALLLGGLHWLRASVGPQRLIADGSTRSGAHVDYVACSLHRSGAGSFAAFVADIRSDGAAVNDEALVHAVISGLRIVAVHARERCAAGGTASLRATVLPADHRAPIRLSQRRFMGFEDRVGTLDVLSAPVATSVADLDELACDNSQLLAAAHRLTTGLMQTFGHPEAAQITPDGALRINYWGLESQARLRAWAAANGVGVVAETVG